VGAGVGTMFWDYAKPVSGGADGTPRSVGHDGLYYFTGFGGGGASLRLSRELSVGASLAGGARLHDRSMASGSKNDLLQHTGFLRILLELSWRIR